MSEQTSADSVCRQNSGTFHMSYHKGFVGGLRSTHACAQFYYLFSMLNFKVGLIPTKPSVENKIDIFHVFPNEIFLLKYSCATEMQANV